MSANRLSYRILSLLSLHPCCFQPVWPSNVNVISILSQEWKASKASEAEQSRASTSREWAGKQQQGGSNWADTDLIHKESGFTKCQMDTTCTPPFIMTGFYPPQWGPSGITGGRLERSQRKWKGKQMMHPLSFNLWRSIIICGGGSDSLRSKQSTCQSQD